MSRKAIYKETIKKNTVEDMKKLGIYKPEYNRVIDIYSELCEQYEIITKRFVEDKYQFHEMTADGGYKKSPIVGTLESLRKDILTYSDRLCLNPKALVSIKIVQPKKSKLSSALSEIR